MKEFCIFKPDFCKKIDDITPRHVVFPFDVVSEVDQTIQNSASVKLLEHLGQLINRKHF